MDIHEELVKEKGFGVVPYNKHYAVGIGDILFHILSVQEGFYPNLYALNLSAFSSFLFPNPLNALEMRLNLLSDILSHHSSLSPSVLQVTRCPSWRSIGQESIQFDRFNTLHLNMKSTFWEDIIPKIDISENYLIFHTKLRMNTSINYRTVCEDIARFCNEFKTNYKIIILGERHFPATWEGDIHKIQTIYSELLQLKNKNEVIDLSVEEIYNTLDYKEYKRDLLLIKNATCNICIGQGGQLCSSLLFGKTAYCVVIPPPPFKQQALERDGHKCSLILSDLFQYIQDSYGHT